MWREVNRYRIASGGQSEDLILERDDDGNFRLRNDFGNVVIEFDKMSAKEFFKKLNDTVNDTLEQDLFDWFANDADTDCDMDSKDNWGAD